MGIRPTAQWQLVQPEVLSRQWVVLTSGDETPTRPGLGCQRPSTAPSPLVLSRGVDSHLRELHGMGEWACRVHPWHGEVREAARGR